ncbi:MAG: dTMP kinase [Deltaproteobacteria bacterium]|jgi:dTMP kinase|nr:dTMP kinase [Deltaproteobacteria bacterium]
MPERARSQEVDGTEGLLICFEGLDGSGKSTQARLLAEALADEAALFKEPSSGPYGKKIRESAGKGRLSPLSEHRLFLADRAHDLRFNILPALKRGKTVILDRYIVSNLAYQGALGLSLSAVMEDNSPFPPPDLVILLELDAAEALKRIRRSRPSAELFEEEGYLNKVAAVLKNLDYPALIRMDALLPPETLAEGILKIVNLLKESAL